MIYLIGNNALTFYLAAKLSDAGKELRIMAGRDENIDIETNGITLKEERILSKKHYKFPTAFLIKEKPELIIISCEPSALNHYLTLLSRKAVKNVPILFFPPLKKIDYIQNLLDTDIIQAYFNGYLGQKDTLISSYGPTPNISICSSPKKHSIQYITYLLTEAGIDHTLKEDSDQGFWEYFVPYAAGSIFTTYHNQTLTQLNRNLDNKDELKAIINELADLSAKDLSPISRENALTKIFSTPSNYIFPLYNSYKNGSKNDVALICGIISDLIRTKPSDYPLLHKITKTLYASFV